MLVGHHDQEHPFVERFGHRLGARQRGGGVAGGAHHQDRAGPGSGDLHARVVRHRVERAEVRPGGARCEARRSLVEEWRVRIVFVHRRAFGGVHAADGLERLERVVVGAVGLTLEVQVEQCEQPAAVSASSVGEGLLQLRPERLVVHRLGRCAQCHASIDVRAIRFTGHRPFVEIQHQRVERALGIAVVVEHALGVGAASCEERLQRVFEPSGLLEAGFEQVGVRVDGPVQHGPTDGVGEQGGPRGTELTAVAEPEVGDLVFAQRCANGVHVAGGVVGAHVLDDVGVL